jgi:flagellar hook assembly protein FlgD
MIQDTRYKIQDIRLKIYDVSGRLVKSFNLESCIMNHESAILWDGDDSSGRKVPAGVYFVRLEADGYTMVEKVIFLR